MDPLSLSASIAGLITMADVIVRNGFKYISEVKEADNSIRDLFCEVNLLVGTLHSLRNIAQRFEVDDSSHTYAMRIDHVNACDKTLYKIQLQLDKISNTKDRSISRTKKRLLWPLSQSETRTILAEVERHKSTMSLALSVDGM